MKRILTVFALCFNLTMAYSQQNIDIIYKGKDQFEIKPIGANQPYTYSISPSTVHNPIFSSTNTFSATVEINSYTVMVKNSLGIEESFDLGVDSMNCDLFSLGLGGSTNLNFEFVKFDAKMLSSHKADLLEVSYMFLERSFYLYHNTTVVSSIESYSNADVNIEILHPTSSTDEVVLKTVTKTNPDNDDGNSVSFFLNCNYTDVQDQDQGDVPMVWYKNNRLESNLDMSSLAIWSLDGMNVFNGQKQSSTYDSALPSGIYMYQAQVGGKIIKGKLAVQ